MIEAGTLSVLTWNIGRVHLGARVNGMFRHDSRGRDAALSHVARVIAASGAEVVGLQELRSHGQLGRLLSRLGEGWISTGMEGSLQVSDRLVGMLARREVMAEARFEVVQLGGRPAHALVQRDRVVLAVHWDAFDARVRVEQARRLSAWVDARPEPTVIVMGDFNIDLRLPLYSRRSDRALWRALVDGRRLVDAGARAGATVMLGRRLDYVLVRGARAEVKVLRKRRVPLGDHDPLFALVVPEAEPRVDSARGVP